MDIIKEELEKESVHALRSLGRTYGVKSPSSLKKAELIKQILDISSGKQEKHVPTSKRGRPALLKTQVLDDENILGEKLQRIKELIANCEKEIMKIILE